MSTPTSTYIFAGATTLLLASSGYLLWQNMDLTKRADALQSERNFSLLENASTTEAFLALNTQFTLTEEQLRETERQLEREQERNKDFEDQINDLAGTVGVLDKLSKTDKELLQKYSKVYFLNENYIPERLKQIDATYILAGKKDQYFHASAWKYLKEMLDDAKDDNIDLKIISAYRSFDEQNDLKGQYTQVYGAGANTFSADQGFSEHQLGTTLDLTDPVTGGTFTTFAQTQAYAWLEKNAYKYGFVLSYPKDNTFYVYEPWHWRFVGEDLARDLHNSGSNFYAWDQRKIDEYLVSIFD